MTTKSNPDAPLKGTEAEFMAIQRSKAEAKLDARGREMVSPVPIAPPLGYKRTPSLAEQIRAMVISEKLKQEAMAAGYESFEEADDFEVGDDYDPTSPYEEQFEGEATPVAAPPQQPAPEPSTAQGNALAQPAAPTGAGS